MNSPTRTRLSPEERKQQLLDAAIMVFARRGIGRGAHADIAQQTGVSVPTVFNYFKTREDLVDAVLNYIELYFVDFAEQHLNKSNLDPLKSVLNHSFGFLHKAGESPDIIKIWLEWSASVREDTWPRYIRFQERVLDVMEPIIQHGLNTGQMNSALSARDLSRIIFGQAHPITLAFFDENRPIQDMMRFVQLGMYSLLGIKQS